MSLGFAAPILVLALARLTGLLRTLRITGRTRVALLATGIAYEFGFIALLLTVGAPSDLTHAVLALVAGAVMLVTLNLFTNASAHTSIWVILTGVLLPQHPAFAAAAACVALSCAWSRVRVGAHTPPQAYALPWIAAAVSALVQVLAS